jgi:ATP-binding cassette subfamily B (MDR/TAP) protein 1
MSYHANSPNSWHPRTPEHEEWIDPYNPVPVTTPTDPYMDEMYNPVPLNSPAGPDFSPTKSQGGVDAFSLDIKPTPADSVEEESAAPKKWWQRGKKAKKPKEEPSVTFLQLFRYCERKDKFLMGFGAVVAVLVGGAMPSMTLVFGRILNNLNDSSTSQLKSNVAELGLIMTCIGIAAWTLDTIGMTLFSISGDRQARKMRCEVFHAVLRQEAAFFDTCKAGELTNMMSSDVQIISTLLGSKIFLLITYLSTFFMSYIFAFAQSWALTLVMMGVTPLIAITGGIMAKVLTSATAKAQAVYATAGAIAQESLAAVRTVHAFDGIDRECDRYNAKVAEVQVFGIRKGLLAGLSQGVTFCILFSSYAIAFYFGSWLIIWNWANPGDVISVFFSVLIGAMQAGLAAPIFSDIAGARGAASKVYQILDRVPEMDAGEDGPGKVLTTLEGHIEFRNLSFTYPARPDLPIFRDFNLTIRPGQRVALVGPSGSGKSSIVALIERFYDPSAGEVLVDGVPLKDLQLHSWRKQVGIVTQEPTLFQTTVMENIRCANPSATEEEVIQACKDAFIHDVISKLPDGYNTTVGESGSQLSGGQKQRVAIARAIVKNPKILLLDEATSALDRSSEMIVQKALDNVMRGRTVVTIAHRLVTIMDSDLICYIQPRDPQAPADSPATTSRMLESGTHEELMKLGGEYSSMVFTQNQAAQLQTNQPAIAGEEGGTTAHNAALAETRHKADEADSIPEVIVEPEDGKKKKKEKKISVFRRTAMLSAPDKWYILVGVAAAALVGTSYPIYAVLFSQVVTLFYESDLQAKIWTWCVLFFGLGLLNFFGYSIKGYCLTHAGETLTYRLRGQLFRSMMSQDIGFFDLPGNESGALCAKLASDTTQIQHMFGGALGANFQAAVSIIVGMIIAYVVSWELALVVSSAIPAVAAAKFFQTKVMYNLVKQSGKGLETAGQVATESINGHRTVFAFNLQESQVSKYRELLNAPAKADTKKAVVAGFFYGFSQFVIFGSFSLSFWYGGQMIAGGRLTFLHLIECSFALLMGRAFHKAERHPTPGEWVQPNSWLETSSLQHQASFRGR